MTESDMESLLHDIGLGDKIRVISNSDDTNIMFCCPFHGERNPSCGISVNKEVGVCFACGQTFTITYLVAYMKDCSIKSAKEYLEEKFNVTKKTRKLSVARRYGEQKEEKPKRKVLPKFSLAPYKSGKVVHNYLLNRGFTKETCKEFMIGFDQTKNRITIPVFWEDGTVAGFIGRAVLNENDVNYAKVYGYSDKYLVYEFEKSKVLYPVHKFELSETKEVNLVEGSLDALKMYQRGFKNTLAILGSKISKEQIELLRKLGVLRINLFLDNDNAGKEGKERVYSLARKDFVVYDVEYPSSVKDPADLSLEQTLSMLKSRYLYGKKNIKKIC